MIKKIQFIHNTIKNYDLIIINGYNHWIFLLNFLIIWISREKKPLIVESDTQYLPVQSAIKKWLKNIYLKTILRRKFVYGFAGGSNHKKLFTHYGMNPEKVHLMPMMVDNTALYKNNNNSSSQKGPFTFLYVGEINENKNVVRIIENFLSLFYGCSYVALTILGYGPLKEYIQNIYAKKEHIQIKGPLYGNELIRTYHNSNAFILASYREQWGLVINEALSAGLPVLASKYAGAAYDLIKIPNTGLLFDPNNDEEIKNAMRQIYTDKAFYKLASQNAENWMKNHWNFKYFENCFHSAIQQIAYES
jgi:glycosyltransferase involved in cell wall biosynthesis